MNKEFDHIYDFVKGILVNYDLPQNTCHVTQRDGMLYGKFSTNGMITGAAGMLNIFDMMPISGWTVYYNGIKLHAEGKEEFYLFLKSYVNKS